MSRAGPADRRRRGDMLGGNGILLDRHVITHMADLQAIYAFQGAETIRP